MKKSIAKNYIYNLTYQILNLILPLITTPYISRVLGAENIGIYSYTMSISTYFILFGSLGIAMYAQREIAYLQNEPNRYSKTFWEMVILRFISMTMSIVVFYITFARSGQYYIYYRILLLELFANCLDISWFFQGVEEFKKIVFRNMIVKTISIISIFSFVKNSNDIIIYLAIYVICTLIGNLSLWVYLPKYLKKVKIKELNIIKHIRPTVMLFIPQIAIQIYTVLDKVMIGTIISDKTEVGYYEQSQKAIKMLLTILTSLGTVMLTRMSNTYMSGDNDKLKKYLKQSFNFVYIVGFPIVFGIISISKYFVPVFFGEGYEKVIGLMNIISPIILAIGLSNVIGTQYLLPTKKQKQFTTSVIAGAVVNFCINILLIGKYGAIGAAIGTVIAEICVTVIQFIYIRKEIDIKEILKLQIKYLISAMIMFFISTIVGRLISNNIYSIVAQITVGIITYVTCLLILKDEFTLLILSEVKKKILRRK